MTLSPRAKLVLIAGGFVLPIVASLIVYFLGHPEPTANYGELTQSETLPTQSLVGIEGEPWTFAKLEGKWILAMWDAGGCEASCVSRLTTLRQVRLALGRNAPRVARVFVADDGVRPPAERLRPFEGTVVAIAPRNVPPDTKRRAHIYLVDPRGNLVMRWPDAPEPKRMLKDLQRLLKASQIG